MKSGSGSSLLGGHHSTPHANGHAADIEKLLFQSSTQGGIINKINQAKSIKGSIKESRPDIVMPPSDLSPRSKQEWMAGQSPEVQYNYHVREHEDYLELAEGQQVSIPSLPSLGSLSSSRAFAIINLHTWQPCIPKP